MERAPWEEMWLTLKQLVDFLCDVRAAEIQDGLRPGTPSAIYVVISQQVNQAIDYNHLADKGFAFHHFRDKQRVKAEAHEYVYYACLRRGPPTRGLRWLAVACSG